MYIQDPIEERRRFKRYKLALSAFYRISHPVYVKLWFGDQEFEAVTVDISEGGMGLLTTLDLPLACTIQIRMTLFRVDREGCVQYFNPGEMTGEVRSKNSQDPKHYRLGISFVQKEEVVTSEINRFIQSSR